MDLVNSPKVKEILFAIGSSDLGGGQLVFFSMIKWHVLQGIKVTVILPPGPLVDKISNVACEIYVLRLDVSYLWKVRKIIKYRNFDIINAHLTKCGFFICLSSAFLGVKICLTLHNDILHNKLNITQSFLYPYLYRILATFVNGIVVPSKYVKNHMHEVANIRLSKMRVVYYVTSPPLREDSITIPTNTILNKNPSTVTCIGRLSIEKGQIYLLQALSLLTDLDLLVWIVGDGPMRNFLETFARDNRLLSRVRFLGYRDDVQSLLEQSDIVVVPSLSEAFGLIIIEAFYAGKVVIASEVGGIPEIIQDNTTGFLVPSGNALALAKKIREAIVNKQKSISVAESARQHAQLTFSLGASARNLHNYYLEIITQESNPE
jgi:glycosyltransferase involved in cell wall biosynthesis